MKAQVQRSPPSVALLLGLFACAPEQAAPVTSEEPDTSALWAEAAMPFWSVLVPAELEGAGTGWYLLDSGAPGLLVDPEVTEVQEATLSWGGVTTPSLPVESYEMELLSGLLGVELDGILGQAAMADRVVALDYRGRRFQLLDAWEGDLSSAEAHADPAEVEITLGDGYLLLAQADFEGLGEPVWVIVDTGTTSALISADLFERLGAEEDGRTILEGSQQVSGTATTSTRIIRLGSVSLAGLEASRAWTSVGSNLLFNSISNALDVEVEAIIGGTVLREFLTVLDYPEGLLRLAPYENLDHVEIDFEMVGVEILSTAEGPRIFTVFTGSEAEAAGIAVDDLLVEIDGVEAAGMSHEEVVAALHGAPGTQVAMTLSREGAQFSVEVAREDLLPWL